MTVPVREWGRRLSDFVRAALDAGDLAAARRLVLEGDGQARSLAREYAYMYRGLGITIRIVARLLGETGASASIAPPAAAAREAGALLACFRTDMLVLMARAYGEVEERGGAAAAGGGLGERGLPGAPEDLSAEIARSVAFLDASEARFDREQGRLADEVVASLDAGDARRARALVDRKEREQYAPLHDRMVRFMADSFAFILRHGGPDGLLRFHMATAEGQRRGFEKWEAMAPEEFARTTAFLLKQHLGAVEVREDAERFTIVQTPCGSGGRLKLMGAYDGPGALPHVETPGPLTFGQPRLAVYCSHCPIWNGVATIQWFGRPHWIFEDASRSDGSCTLHVYKRHDGAPAAYTRLLTLPGPSLPTAPGSHTDAR